MLLSFSVSNYRSVKDAITFSMEPILPKSNKDENLIITDRYVGLKSAVIYGANASGKSNLISAMKFVKDFVLGSATDSNVGNNINVEPFLLSSDINPSSTFEIVFTADDTRYRYGFTCDTEQVLKEWCFEAKKRAEYPLFLREADEINVENRFKEGNGLELKTRNNALFLSVVSQFNGSVSGIITNWFRQFNTISGLGDEDYFRYSAKQYAKPENKPMVLALLKAADMDIVDLDVTHSSLDPRDLPKDFPEELKKLIVKSGGNAKGEMISIRSKHEKFDENLKLVGHAYLDYHANESKGTQKFFSLSGPILNTIKYGKVLIIDELDARLHPKLTQVIVNIFNSTKSNPHNAQLIFATHDTNLINRKSFRRDQIWFAEKDQGRATDIYSLAEYNLPDKKGKVREDQSWEKDYIKGRYGAIPYLGDFSALIAD